MSVKTLNKRIIGIAVLLVVLVGVTVGGKDLWSYFDSYESTDDAQIDAHMNPVSSRISGTVIGVHFEDNQTVQGGQVLIDLDQMDYQVQLEQASANVVLAASQVTAESPNVAITATTNETTVATAQSEITSAEAAIAAAERDYDSATANLREAEANSARAQADETRYRGLAEKEEVSKSIYDQKLADARTSAAIVEARQANVEVARRIIAERQASLVQARTRLAEAVGNNPRHLFVVNAVVQTRQASLEVAKALLDQAQLNLTYTRISAPAAGIVGKKNVEVGQRIQAGETLLTITQTDDLWVTANFKETQLRRMHTGQKVTISVDAFDKDFEGTVDSLPGATGARFSVLPPENATGNYVKVVQRLPVRIRLNRDQQGLNLLRPGMSVVPTVWIR